MSEDGYASVRMGEYACTSKQGSKNEAKGDINGQIGSFFSTYVHVQKMLHVAKDDCGAQRGPRGGTKNK